MVPFGSEIYDYDIMVMHVTQISLNPLVISVYNQMKNQSQSYMNLRTNDIFWIVMDQIVVN